MVRTIVTNKPAWVAIALNWLLTSPDSHVERRTGIRRIGIGDVEALRGTISMFADLDNRFGGGHSRPLLLHYLATDMGSMLKGIYTDDVGRVLFSTAAEATLLGAWMSYDAGFHGLAQRYFIHALRLAQAADDTLLGNSILAAMSHQANYLGDFTEAADLARAAVVSTRARAPATLLALFHTQEARALASAGDQPGCTTALRKADGYFATRNVDDDPTWISYFDGSELAAEFAHCFRDLDQPHLAHEYAAHSLATADEQYVRSLIFVRLVLATTQLPRDGRGDLEQACATALTAVRAYGHVKSSRPLQYLSDFRRRLEPYLADPIVQRYTESLSDLRLPQ
jgi:hypothetical protein